MDEAGHDLAARLAKRGLRKRPERPRVSRPDTLDSAGYQEHATK